MTIYALQVLHCSILLCSYRNKVSVVCSFFTLQ
uniref:Uncharacterized protein n=1 Tax=Arundo donax TaxID=35708 RepID=A0A0A9BYE0_ARUDO